MQVIPTLHVPNNPMGHFPSSPLYGDRRKPGRCKDAMSWGKHDQQGTSPGQPAQPVLACSSARDLTGQSMPHVQASRAFSCSMNPVTPTLVPKPKFVHWPGCQGTHEARHLLFHCPFYNSTGKEPLDAVHTFGSGLQGQVPGQGRPKRLPEGQVCKPKLSSLRLIH